MHRLFPHSHHPHWRSFDSAPSTKGGLDASPMEVMWIQYDYWQHLNMGVLLYYICQWCYSQNSTLNVVRVVFDLPKTSDIILFQTINYILEISYRFIEFLSPRVPSLDNILYCNEHKKCWKTAKIGYFPLKCMIFLQYLCKTYYQQHIIMECDFTGKASLRHGVLTRRL